MARYAMLSRGAFTQSALAQLSRAFGVIMIMYKVSTSSLAVATKSPRDVFLDQTRQPSLGRAIGLFRGGIR